MEQWKGSVEVCAQGGRGLCKGGVCACGEVKIEWWECYMLLPPWCRWRELDGDTQIPYLPTPSVSLLQLAAPAFEHGEAELRTLSGSR